MWHTDCSIYTWGCVAEWVQNGDFDHFVKSSDLSVELVSGRDGDKSERR